MPNFGPKRNTFYLFGQKTDNFVDILHPTFLHSVVGPTSYILHPTSPGPPTRRDPTRRSEGEGETQAEGEAEGEAENEAGIEV